ncbi:hypothetical protein D9619_008603 [Psilocybe cf. subviscida]|uniref:FHA domain-containing protein n=1 Tax=Psilocybe cf. subviscida TaxID=2480587 RepID=A0A8H5BAG8_9AGAR|nr:hypothetical protein D9619_008603 [Psilocybe cf. subviscida]
MLDDEIVFLGSSNPLTGAGASQRPVTGISLHVQKNGIVEAHTLTFRRATTSVIEIGRRSGADLDPEDDELENAMFRCAVVSRKHAKIAFTDAGKACLIDRNSHHGTHVRKASETVSKMIKPETYTLLADGDLVTFGKAVGKGDDAVPPIIARVELHYAAEGEMIKLLNVTSTSSGHYGLNDQSSSSDESSCNNYSDIEEITNPVEKKQLSFSSSAASALNSVLKLTQRLPPLWLAEENITDELVQLPRPRGYGDQERDEDSVSSLHAGHFVASNEWDDAESCSNSSDDEFSSRSRSNSPMELASPSPAPVEFVEPPQPGADLTLVPVPALPPMLTWPPSSSLRVPPPLPMLPPFPPMRMFPPPALNVNATEPVDSPQFTARLVPPPPWVLQPKPTCPPPAALLPERPVDHSPEDETKSLHESDNEDDDRSISSSRDAQMEDIDERLYALENVTDKLQSYRRKYRKKFNANVELLNTQLAGVDDRISEVNAECTVLFERVERLHGADVPELQGQMESVQERLDDLEEKDKARAAELTRIVDSIKHLKAETEQKMAADLAEVKALLERAMLDKVRPSPPLDSPKRDFTWAPGPQTPVLPSLKRKRDDIDENGEEDGHQHGHGPAPGEYADRPVIAIVDVDTNAGDMAPGLSATEMEVDVSIDPVVVASASDSARPRKRTRRIASALAQSATALTIGAVVTWSALAFS